MKKGESRWDEQYARMGGKPDVKRAMEIFNIMVDYIEFYEYWIYTCAALNRSIRNPNRALVRRWNRRGQRK